MSVGLLVYLFISTVCFAQVVVFSPEIRKEYQYLYDQTFAGIKKEDPKATFVTVSTDNIAQAIKKRESKRVIVLDPELIRTVERLNLEVPWRAGVYTWPPKIEPKTHGLSLNINPDIIFTEIKNLSPKIRTVHTVIFNDIKDDVLQDAHQKAESLGITLVVKAVNDPRELAKAWFKIVNDIDTTTQAIWISNERFLESTKTLQYLLTQSWKKDILVTSSIPSHAVRGVGLGVIPDFYEYGRSLVKAFEQREFEGSRSLTREEVKTVANVRTLRHIGYRSLEKADDLYDMVFPQ